MRAVQQLFLTIIFWMNQSDTAGVRIPEIDLELSSGTLGGLVTTIEGLITKISESECFSFLLFRTWVVISIIVLAVP